MNENAREKQRQRNRDREWTPEMRAKVAESVRTRARESPDSEETRQKKAVAGRRPKSEETRQKMAEARRRFWENKTPEERSAITKKSGAKNNLAGFAAMHRKRETRSEIVFAAVLGGLGVEYEHQKVFGRYIVDFYLPKYDLIVEVDERHHREPWMRARDEERNAWFAETGHRVLHVSIEEIDAGDFTALVSALRE